MTQSIRIVLQLFEYSLDRPEIFVQRRAAAGNQFFVREFLARPQHDDRTEGSPLHLRHDSLVEHLFHFLEEIVRERTGVGHVVVPAVREHYKVGELRERIDDCVGLPGVEEPSFLSELDFEHGNGSHGGFSCGRVHTD